MPADLIYAVTSDIDPALESAFNAWYNTEHVVELLAVPGFTAARRFQALDGSPKYLAVYDLADVDILEQYAFQRIRPTHPDSTAGCKEMWSHVKNWKRAAYQQLFAPEHPTADGNAATHLFLSAYDLDPAADADFQTWYEQEHWPGVSTVPGVVRTRCFRLHPKKMEHLLGEPSRCMVLYDLADADVCRRADWLDWQQTPRTRQLRQLSKSPMRNFYQRIYPD